jgi:hypothetical protein
MSGLWRWPNAGRALAAAGTLVVAAPAEAQLLDLKPGAGVGAMAGDGTAALIEHLDGETSRLRDELGRAVAAGAGTLDPTKRLAFELRIASRRCAHTLLSIARDRGEPAAAHALAGITMVDRFDAFDAWAAEVERGGAGAAAEAARAFTAAEASLASALDEPALDRWLTSALGPRAQSLGFAPAPSWNDLRLRAGWIERLAPANAPPPLADLVARWTAPSRADKPGAKQRELTADAAAALRELATVSGETAGSWADAPTSLRLERLIRTAGAVLDGLDPTPSKDTADTLAAKFNAACAALGHADPAALAALERLAATVQLADATAGALSKAPRGITPATREQVWKNFWVAQLGTSPDNAMQRDAHRRAVESLLHASDQVDETALVREARPLLRRLNTELDMAERELWLSLARPASRNPMDDPGIVGSLATVRRLDGAIRGLAVVAGLVAPPKVKPARPEPGPVKVRDRLIALARELEKPATRDAAMTNLLQLLDRADAFSPGPGERAIRAAPADARWSGPGASRVADLLAAIDSARAGALRAWGEARPDTSSEVARVASLARLLELVHTAAVASEMVRQGDASRVGRISRHPGVELPAAAGAALLADVEASVARLVPGALEPATRDKVLTQVDALHDASAGVRLVTALEVDAAAFDLVTVDPALELSANPVPGAWLAEHRTDLALLCWHALELSRAQLRSDRDQVTQRTAQINLIAQRLLEARALAR